MIRPELVRKKRIYKGWNPGLVAKLIFEMNRAKIPTSVRSLRLWSGTVPDPFLTKITKQPLSKKELHELACHFYGTWGKAQEAASVQRGAPASSRFWSQDLIIKSIQALYESGHPLTVSSIWRDRSRKTAKVLKKIVGRRTTGSSLHDASRRFFCTWDRALVAAGVDVLCIKEKPFWTKEKILGAILFLKDNRIPLNPASLQQNRDKKITKLIEKRFGKGKPGSSLYEAGYRIFGTWRRAIEQSGLDPRDHFLDRFQWDKRSVAKIIKALHKAKIPLNGGSISRNISVGANSIVLKASGRTVQARRIYSLGRKHLGSWDGSLRHSGLEPSLIRKISSPCYLTKEELIPIIQALYKCEFPLNSTVMHRQSIRVRYFIGERFKLTVGGRGIMRRSKELFGSWDQALWDCGLNPNEIRRISRPRTTNLPVVLYQVEDVKVDGERRRTKYLGAPPKSPDAVLEEENAKLKLESAVGKMGKEDQEVTEQIFNAILQMHHYRDQKQLIQFVNRWLDGAVSEQKIAAILTSLAEKIAA